MSSGPSQLADKRRNYLELLRFCRDLENDANTDQDTGSVVLALNSLQDGPGAARSLFPLLYQNAGTTGLWDQLEQDAQQFLKTTAMVLVAREAASQRWLKKAIESFQKADIPIILLKGAAFSGYLYTEEAPRPGVDVDLLVQQRDFKTACDILQQTMNPLVIDEDRLATHENLFERVFMPDNSSNPAVELHRGLTNPHIFNISEDALWQASEPHCNYNNENVRVLSPNHTLLHLAVHGFRDLDFCSHSLLDADRMVLLRGIDEKSLYKDAQTWGAKAVLYHFLINCKQLMGTRIPVSLLSRLEPRRLSKRAQLMALANAPLETKGISRHRFRQLWSQLIFPDRLSAALKFQTHYSVTRFKDLLLR